MGFRVHAVSEVRCAPWCTGCFLLFGNLAVLQVKESAMGLLG